MAARYVIHNYPTSDGILHLPLDDKWFRIPAGEPFEIETDSNGRTLDTPEYYTSQLLSQYGPLYGLVDIPMTRTRNGITLDVDSALVRADAALASNRHRHVNLWASDQLSTRVSKNLPVLPPSGFVAESVRLLGIDLAATYNIRPVGWDFHPTPGTSTANPSLLQASSDQGEEIVALRAQNEELGNRLAGLERLLQQLVDATPANPTPSEKPSITPKGSR